MVRIGKTYDSSIMTRLECEHDSYRKLIAKWTRSELGRSVITARRPLENCLGRRVGRGQPAYPLNDRVTRRSDIRCFRPARLDRAGPSIGRASFDGLLQGLAVSPDASQKPQCNPHSRSWSGLCEHAVLQLSRPSSAAMQTDTSSVTRN